MNYFWTEEERKHRRTTECIEFQRGGYKDVCWKADSLCIHDDIFTDIGLDKILRAALPDFDYYGITQVDKKQWEKIKDIASKQGGEAAVAVTELASWAEETFKTEKIFTVLGI